MIIRRSAACPCTADSGRVRQHRADSQLRQADRHHSQSGNLASIILQSQSQLKAIYKDAAEIISDNCDSVLFLSGRGKNAKRSPMRWGKRPSTVSTPARTGVLKPPRNELSKIRKGVDVRGRNRNHGRRQMYFAAAGCEAVLLGEVRHHQAPATTNTLRTRTRKNTFDVDRFLSPCAGNGSR